MRAHYPGAELDNVGQLRLAGAYWRRKRLEARLVAYELARLLQGSTSTRNDRIAADDMFARLGAD